MYIFPPVKVIIRKLLLIQIGWCQLLMFDLFYKFYLILFMTTWILWMKWMNQWMSWKLLAKYEIIALKDMFKGTIYCNILDEFKSRVISITQFIFCHVGHPIVYYWTVKSFYTQILFYLLKFWGSFLLFRCKLAKFRWEICV